MSPRHVGLALALLAACLAPGCATDTTTGSPTALLVHAGQHTIEAGRFLELNLRMTATANLTASFEATAPLAWDVHSHDGREAVVHEDGTAANGTIAFQAPRNGAYSLMWENPGDTATNITVTVRGDAMLESIVP